MFAVAGSLDDGIRQAFCLGLAIPLVFIGLHLPVEILLLYLIGPPGGQIPHIGDAVCFGRGDHCRQGFHGPLIKFTGAVLHQIAFVVAPIGGFIPIVDQDQVPGRVRRLDIVSIRIHTSAGLGGGNGAGGGFSDGHPAGRTPADIRWQRGNHRTVRNHGAIRNGRAAGYRRGTGRAFTAYSVRNECPHPPQ